MRIAIDAKDEYLLDAASGDEVEFLIPGSEQHIHLPDPPDVENSTAKVQAVLSDGRS